MPRRIEKYRTGSDGYKRHQITYKDVNGTTQRKRLVARSDYEMDQKINAFNRSIGAGAISTPSTLTVSEWADYWVESTIYGTVKPKTYHGYICHLTRLKDALGSIPLTDVKPIMLQQVLNSMTGMSTYYVGSFRNVLRNLFSAAVSNGLLIHSPAEDLKRPKTTSGTHRFLTHEEISLCTKIAESHRFGLCAMLMLYAGLRPGEAAAFDVDRDVNFTKWQIHIKHNLSYHNNVPTLDVPKTALSIRTIPVMPPLRPFLIAARGKGHALRSGDEYKNDMHSTDYLGLSGFDRAYESFVTYISDAQNGFTKRWPKKDKNGNPMPYKQSNIRCYDFRHTFASLCYEAGVDVKTTQKWMGHATPDITMRIYTHLSSLKEEASTDAAFSYFTSLSAKCKEV